MTNERASSILLRRVRRSKLVHNIVALSGTQIALYAFPLMVIPYLARVLGPTQWGVVAFAQSLGLYFGLIVDFGFQLSATRRMAKAAARHEEVEEIVAGVIGAKIFLTLLCVGSLLVLQFVVPAFREHRLIMWEGGMSGIASGFSMLWFYQGLEEMKTSATLDVVGRALAAAGIFVFVKSQADAWKVLAIQMVSFTSITLILLIVAYRRVCFRWPSLDGTIHALRESASMFLFRSAVSLYTTANALILGIVAPPLSVGYYSGAERLMKAMLAMLGPLSQSLYPRLNRLIATDTKRAISLARLSLIAMGIAGCCLGTGAYVLAPAIVHVALGPHFGESVKVLRILSILLPAIALSNVLGMQWMLPLHLDKAFNRVIIVAGVLNVLLAALWATKWKHIGMAWAVATSESLVTALMVLVLVGLKVAPWMEREELETRLKQIMMAEPMTNRSR